MFWKEGNKAVYRKSNSIKNTLFQPNNVATHRFLLQAWRCDEKTNWIRNYLKLLKGLKRI